MGEGLITRRGTAVPPEIISVEEGIVLSFFGNSEELLDGWAVCDGTNGTPDLRNRLTVCSGSSYADNSTGGFSDVLLPQHSHTWTVNSGGNHGGGTLLTWRFQGGNFQNPAIGEGLHTGQIVTTLSGNHNHSISVQSNGIPAQNANYPPYMALNFIRKQDSETPGIPEGAIINWSGSLLELPEGWFLCNGENNTPNLTNRFILGASNTFPLNTTGGQKNGVLVEHTHTTITSTNTTGSHGHSCNKASGFGSTGFYDGTQGTNQIQLNHPNHTHTTNCTTAGENNTDRNLPPYYALAFLMKGE